MDEEDIELDDRDGDSEAEAAQPAASAQHDQHDQPGPSHRNLEEALLVQMDMQKRLAEQLEVSSLSHCKCDVLWRCLDAQPLSDEA